MDKDIENTLCKHKRIALQFSGGRDSLACLYLMRPYWDLMTVYWTDTGAAYPETINTVQKVQDMVPNFAVIDGKQPQVIAEYGIPTDILPVSSTPMGVVGSGKGSLMQDRYSCCLRSIMLPMHERMLQDGITLIIRGQKNADNLKSVVRSGDVLDGIEYYFPIEDWDSRKVMDYLRLENVEVPRFYEMLNSTPDCMSCSAYWEDGAMGYLKRYHYDQYKENLTRLDSIKASVGEHISAFNKEVGL
jgi:phosphoadenosine phosphosulfate reductase